MQTKKGKCINKKTKNKTQKGGKTKIDSPIITRKCTTNKFKMF